ncbi:PKD domain-containing protein [Flammeovirga sp. SR4]|uniref:PKD domain-containing protein n=2 Tax=Flammeovirga agarivorans TaxID=2726742 RepID=A0A7X8SGZ7_9BACT|nr:PKD domain-containing protein [Flammeovirga agarivorans]
MKTMNYFVKISAYALLLGALSCSSDDTEMEGPMPVANFTYEISEENDGTVTFTSSSENKVTSVWDFGDGSDISQEDHPIHTYLETGTYEVSLTAIGETSSDIMVKQVDVVIEEDNGGFGDNLVTSGDMTDETAWTLRQVWADEGNEILHEFIDETFVFDIPEGNEYSSSFFYQKVSGLEAGKTYQFNAHVKSSGTSSVWFEVHFGNEDPESGAYEGGARVYMSSFGGEGSTCSVDAFDGDINAISQNGCANPDESEKLINADGTFTLTAEELTEDGSIYLVFKVGSGWGTVNFGDEGIALDEVSIKEVLD